MITAALIQAQDPRRPGDEERALMEALPLRGIPVTTFTRKRLQRRQLPLAPSTLVAGGVDAVQGALRQLGVDGPFLSTYPCSVRALLGRAIAETTVGSVLSREDDLPVFVKPAAREKRFTGFVYGGYHDAIRFEGASRGLAVWVSEVVRFTSERRVYVVGGVARASCSYAGDAEVAPPDELVRDAIDALSASGERVAGFALDVGRLEDGRWVVVECNDGFGLGRYAGCPADVYADLVCARWTELCVGRDGAP
jgi:hypothetical protein